MRMGVQKPGSAKLPLSSSGNNTLFILPSFAATTNVETYED
jgi:hypothetical protein